MFCLQLVSADLQGNAQHLFEDVCHVMEGGRLSCRSLMPRVSCSHSINYLACSLCGCRFWPMCSSWRPLLRSGWGGGHFRRRFSLHSATQLLQTMLQRERERIFEVPCPILQFTKPRYSFCNPKRFKRNCFTEPAAAPFFEMRASSARYSRRRRKPLAPCYQ